jgi:multiple sugar transport system permease protein
MGALPWYEPLRSRRATSAGAARRMGKIAIYLFLSVSAIAFIVPLWWQIATSLKVDEQIFTFPPIWIPRPVDWANYPEALTFIPFFRYLWNTLYISFWNVIGIVISSSLTAYGLSRVEWPGRDFLFKVALATMMLPYAVTMIPLYIVFTKLGWVGTYAPLIIPAFFGSGFDIFLLRQFFMTIPMELSDAGKMDGASHWDLYWRIILPLSKPALTTVALFTFLHSWQDFMGPLLYISNDAKLTLALGLQKFMILHDAEWAYLMAASTTFTVPIIILFFLVQRTFIQGITLTGIKA